MPCLFCQIIAGKAPAEVLYQDDLVTAFRDIFPVAPVHVLIVPNRHIASVNHTEAQDEAALGRMFSAARRLAAELGVAEGGYRLVVNTGRDGGQAIFHLHMHLIGGRRLRRLG